MVAHRTFNPLVPSSSLGCSTDTLINKEESMNEYEIIICKEEETHVQVATVHSFAEAATQAYNTRNKLGMDWKILSVRKL